MIQCPSESICGGPREASTDIDYEGVRSLLEASDLSPSPSEAHGILCGLICGGDPQPAATWLDQLLPSAADAEAADLLAAEARSGLAGLAERTLGEFQGPGLGFSLLLPDESVPLVERATAVYDWVRGFLFALGVLGVGEQDLSEQTREVFHDFSELTRLDLGALDEGEDNEAALTELSEFVWVAAMLLYQERILDPMEPLMEPRRRRQ
jgi:uncharacterized protein YgfB (UPF0149 family)